MKKFLAILLLGFSSVYAQTVNAVTTTPNLITSGTTHTWYGVTTGALPSNYMPGGPTPIYDPSTNTISFSYGSASVGQVTAINQALANVGAGVKINGYTYSYDVRNMNGDDRQPGIDTFTVSQLLRGPQNSVLLNSSQYYNTKFEWKTVTGTKTATTPYNIADTSYIQFGISGADNGYWGGYFGPQVRNVDMRLNYSIDPCVTNPAFSPTCPNYNTVAISENLLSGITGPQAYAINQALSAAGAGAMIHGFNYGYDYRTAARDCAMFSIVGVCLTGWNYSSAGVNTSITDNNNAVIYTDNTNHGGGNSGTGGTYSKEYRFDSSLPIATLGTFSMNPWTNGSASINNMYSKAVYTADPCVSNPLSSTSCPGYAAAYMSQQCTANPLYNSACPGYAAALFTQQCNANQLSDPRCPGYASAYLDQQCSINPMYSTTCSGYTTANSECTANPLSHSYCTNYSTAQTECSTNPLYGSYCPGYTTASLECSLNPLSHSYCPTYTSATTSCSVNSLTYSFCPGYTAATTTCSTNPLSNSMCSNYTTATTQCNLNSLYASYCPGYTTAVTTCSTDPLSNSSCSSYTTASTECSTNQLSHSYCPSYTSTLNTCSTNPLSNSMCSGYQTATSSCTTNPLYASYCSGYQTALDTCSTNPLSNTMCPTYQATTTTCAANPLTASYCPGYQFAYDCGQDGLYSKQCPNYSEAYAKKYVLNISPTPAATPMASTPVVVAQATTADAVVTQASSGISDPAVSNVVTASKTTAASSETNPAAAVKLTAPAPAAATAVAETKKEETKPNGSSNTNNSAGDSSKPSDQPKSNREALAERRRDAAQKEAVAKGKDLANEMGKAADMEAQKAVQNVVIQAMGFTPGFDTYNKAMIPDTTFYRPYSVYGNQRNVDNQNISRRLMGGSDRVHQEMIDSQYQLGK